MKTSELFTVGGLALFLGVMIFALGLLFFNSIEFYVNSVMTDGKVTHIASENDRCRRSKRSYNCTKYTATVYYNTPQGEYITHISAGSSTGHNNSTTLADYKIGEKVEILYDPDNPADAYPNTFSALWSGPLMFLALPFIFVLKYLNNFKEWFNQNIGSTA